MAVRACQRSNTDQQMSFAPPLIVKDEFADRFWELFALPPALAPPCGAAVAFLRGGPVGLDRVGGRTQFVGGDMCDDPRPGQPHMRRT